MKTEHLWHSWHFEVWQSGNEWISHCVGIGIFKAETQADAILIMRNEINQASKH